MWCGCLATVEMTATRARACRALSGLLSCARARRSGRARAARRRRPPRRRASDSGTVGLRRPARQLAEVDVGRGAVGQAAELREAARHRLEPRRLRREHLHRVGLRRRRVASQPLDGEADRRERVLELVRHAARRLAERLARAPPRARARGRRASSRAIVRMRRRSVPNSGAPRGSGSSGSGCPRLHERRPPHQLVERAAELPAQVPRDARRDHGQHHRAEHADDEHARARRAARRSCTGAPARASARSSCSCASSAARCRRAASTRRAARERRARARPSPPRAPTPRSPLTSGSARLTVPGPQQREEHRGAYGEEQQDGEQARAEPVSLHWERRTRADGGVRKLRRRPPSGERPAATQRDAP